MPLTVFQLQDLDSLMLFYREWAHYAFPEARFADFVSRVKKETSSRLMKQYLHDLRHRSSSDADALDFAEVDAGLADISRLVQQRHSSPAAPQPAGSAEDSAFGMPSTDELDDVDAREAFEEMEVEAAAATVATATVAPAGQSAEPPVDFCLDQDW